MHDPMVVAFSIPSPIPRRSRWQDHPDLRPGSVGGRLNTRKDGRSLPPRRWGWTRNRRRNGDACHPWWRPKGWGPLRLAGYAWALAELVCIWHVEPGGRDSGEVCRHTYGSHKSSPPWPAPWKLRWLPWYKLHPALPPDPANDIYPNGHDAWVSSSAWKYHVRHWHLSIRPEQRLRRRIECCTLCRRPYRRRDAVISHQWDSKPVRWRDWLRTRHRLPHGYHEECSSLVHTRSSLELARTALDRLGVTSDQLQSLGVPFTPAFNIGRDLDGWRERLEKEWEELDPAARLLLGTRPIGTLHGHELALVLHNVLPLVERTA